MTVIGVPWRGSTATMPCGDLSNISVSSSLFIFSSSHLMSCKVSVSLLGFAPLISLWSLCPSVFWFVGLSAAIPLSRLADLDQFG